MSKVNPFIKPSGKQKGSQTIAAKGDHKGALPSRKVHNYGQKVQAQYFGSSTVKNGPKDNVANPSKVIAMAKIMKAYPQGPLPYAQKVVKANTAAMDQGKGKSAAPARNLKYIGK